MKIIHLDFLDLGQRFNNLIQLIKIKMANQTTSKQITGKKRVRNLYKTAIILFQVGSVVTLLIIGAASSTKVCTDSDCEEGQCINGTCVCNHGWRGDQCDECYGRIRLPPGEKGIIHDGSANYSKDLACSWLLDAGEEHQHVHFKINSFSTECIWDHLYIHDGDSVFAPLVVAYSGIMPNPTNEADLNFQLSGRYAFIHFYSDAAYILQGFNLSYKIDSCVTDCGNNGTCSNGTCECDNCYDESCPLNCSDHGTCKQGECQCYSGYKGISCEISDGDLFVEAIPKSSTTPEGRASAVLVYDDAKSLWLFGGYRLGNQSEDGNLYKYSDTNDADGVWSQVSESESTPWPRYAHSVVLYQGKFYLFGGVSNSKIKKDFWSFDESTGQWAELGEGPRDLSGHTAHAVNDTMLVFFGYSTDYGYSNKLFAYNFTSLEWTTINTFGALVTGGYGHSSVYDRERKKIYIYGGYHSTDSKTYNMTDKLYQFDTETNEWFNLRSSGSPRYLHGAALMNGLMVTYGGSPHNETRVERQRECFASDIMVYDIECNSWHTIPSSKLYDNLDSMGHCITSVNDVIFVFGGFTSLVQNDFYKFTAGSCSFYEDSESCKNSYPGVKCLWNSDHCEEAVSNTESCSNTDSNSACSGYNTCQSCLSASASCKFCGGVCVSTASNLANCTKDVKLCKEKWPHCSEIHTCHSCEEEDNCRWDGSNCNAINCSSFETCRDCQQQNCGWCNVNGANKCIHVDEGGATCRESNGNQCSETGNVQLQEQAVCKKACGAHASCSECTSNNCMWCSNLNRCIGTNAYIVAFHYGQCMDWTTHNTSCLDSNCSSHKTCTECQAVPKCGWCSDETNTGTGTCHDGSMSGPITFSESSPMIDLSICPATRWYFNDCPLCQCNGHSTCFNNTNVCKSCEFPTTGSQCQYCSKGYYGKPQHGGSCKVCDCNNQADSCDPVTGDCYCRTRGVINTHCDSCDGHNKYSGDPKNGGTCYYRLSTDYQYTFNLSKPEDQNYTNINFINTPSSNDRDVDFTLNCSGTAFINITYKSRSFPSESEYISGHLCDYFRTKFEHKNHAFGGSENTTFMVYVYDFKTPFLLQISFVQQEKINLYKFFIIFFSCFLALILLVAALWKIKHKVESYRRGRRLEVEMQQMARRPFSSIVVEVERKSNLAVADRKDPLDSVLRRRKKQPGNKPSSVAYEPLRDNKAAILTLLIQLPTGLSEYAPSGSSGIALGSALVSVGSNRKQSLELIKGEKPKARKNIIFNNADACA